MTYSTDHIAMGLMLMAFFFVPIAAATASGLYALERLGVVRLAVSAWKLALILALWTAWWAQALYWLGRERAQYERAALLDPYVDWNAGWNVFQWPSDGQSDLFLPIVANAVVVIAVSLLLMARVARTAAKSPLYRWQQE